MPTILSRLYWSAYLGYHLRGQGRYPFKPLSVIKRDQSRRVRKTISYAYRWVPYYRETMTRLGLRPSDITSADDLTKLPIIESDQLRRDPERYVSRAKAQDHYLCVRTSGSTGKPRSVYHDLTGLLQHKASIERSRSIITALLGRTFGYKETRIATHLSVGRQMEEFYQSHAFWPPVVGVRRQELYLRDPARKNLPRINEFKPDVIDSFGSYLTILFRYIEETGEEFHPPKVVLYDSDGMSDSVKRLIEGKFKTPVFSRYGAAEAMAIGFDCPRRSGLHVNIDLYPVRVVDSARKSVVNGETGELVVSNLINRGTVLLNYLLGDIAALLPNQCVCGRSLPLLSYPLGRSDDLIQLPSGDVIHHHAVRAILVEEDLWEFQVVQQTGTRFKVEIVPTGSCDLETTKTRIAEKFAETFGENITVEISFVDSIERTGAGKFRRVISLVNSSQDEMVNGTERR